MNVNDLAEELIRRARMGERLGVSPENQAVLEAARRTASALNCQVYAKHDKRLMATFDDRLRKIREGEAS